MENEDFFEHVQRQLVNLESECKEKGMKIDDFISGVTSYVILFLSRKVDQKQTEEFLLKASDSIFKLINEGAKDDGDN